MRESFNKCQPHCNDTFQIVHQLKVLQNVTQNFSVTSHKNSKHAYFLSGHVQTGIDATVGAEEGYVGYWVLDTCPNVCSIMTEVKTSESEENTLNSKGYKLIKFLGEGAYAKVTFIDLMCTMLI